MNDNIPSSTVLILEWQNLFEITRKCSVSVVHSLKIVECN